MNGQNDNLNSFWFVSSSPEHLKYFGFMDDFAADEQKRSKTATGVMRLFLICYVQGQEWTLNYKSIYFKNVFKDL